MARSVHVYGAGDLRRSAALAAGQSEALPVNVDLEALFRDGGEPMPDLSDVQGQAHVKRALEVAAAGHHNLLLVGPPGGGKTMLAQRIPSILPPLELEEALEVTQVHSAAGLLPGLGLVTRRPFRHPHHTVSEAGLAGGGAVPRPGEISLAHHGVLFLDEFPEFSRGVLETLRQPMEDGRVTIGRAQGSLTFPARIMLAAAMNPCPCGWHGDRRRECRCTPVQVQRYRARVSGPLLDRIDLHVEVGPVAVGELASRPAGGETSETVRARVAAARRRQVERFRADGITANAQMRTVHLRRHCALDAGSEALLSGAAKELGLSARAYHRVLRVARTVADLEGVTAIAAGHVAEALQYRAAAAPG